MKTTSKSAAPGTTRLTLRITLAGPVEPAEVRRRVREALGAQRVVVQPEKAPARAKAAPVMPAVADEDPFGLLDALSDALRASGPPPSLTEINDVVRQVRRTRNAR